MKTILSAVAVLAMAGSAAAGSITFSQAQAFGGELSPFNLVLQFDQLDANTLGLQPGEFIQIKSVNLFVEGTISANVAAENDNVEPAPEFGVNLTGNLNVSIGALSAGVFVFQAAASGGVDGSDGVPGSGPDFFNFGQLGDTGSDDDKIFGNDPAVAAFLGNGTINADIFASGGFAVSGASNSTLFITDFGVSGTVTLDITYNIIPTPGAVALFGLAGLSAARRRRA